MSSVIKQVSAAGREFLPDQRQIFPPVKRPVIRPLNNLDRHLGLTSNGKALLVIAHLCNPVSRQRPSLQTVMFPKKAQKAVVVTVPSKAPPDAGQERSGQVKHIAT